MFGTSKYKLDNFKRAEGWNRDMYAPGLEEALNAKRNLLIAKGSTAAILAGLAIWGAWLIGLDTVFWGLTLVCTLVIVFFVVTYLWDKAWDFAFWLQDQKQLLSRAKDYGVRDE